ncbi:hypothetical protein Q8A67_025407 [Cirrhinus molitorella]|uniref:Uncharacterized protein n=1 Tax=Cirrhinus molitorella TaxID=172907 RepID=A0AA88NW36_9TELE|nr:hypothetical protein Q8A67_025407 [Cirrhinus molitorella]
MPDEKNPGDGFRVHGILLPWEQSKIGYNFTKGLHELSRYGSHGQQTGSQRSLPLFGPRGLSVASIQVERAGKLA